MADWAAVASIAARSPWAQWLSTATTSFLLTLGPNLFSSRTPLTDLEPRRVCLIKPSALGDVVQTLPVITMLRRRWPQAHLSWVINLSLAELLQGQPDLNQVIEFDRTRRGLGRLAATLALYRRLRENQFDLVVDLQGLLRSGLMGLATGAARRVGFSNAREGATRAYTDCVDIPSRDLPALEKYRRVAAAFGCHEQPPPARLGITDENRRWVRAQMSRLPRPWVAIHPGAQWQTKRWPPEHFAELARRTQQMYGAGVVLVGGRDDMPLCDQIAGQLPGPVVNLSHRTNLLRLAALTSAVDVFLSGDTGPMHLAAAMGTRVVSIFTCTSPLRAGPRGQESGVVATQVACAASYLKQCRAMVCMQDLQPDRVWPKLAAVLQEAAGDRQGRAA